MTTLKTLAQALALFRDLDPTAPVQTVQCFCLIASAPKEDIHMIDLQTQMGLASSSTSRNVAALSAHHRLGKPGMNLVENYFDPLDGRYKRVRLTAKGRQLKARIEHLLG